MDFNKLEVSVKESLHNEFSTYSKILEGDNFFFKNSRRD